MSSVRYPCTAVGQVLGFYLLALQFSVRNQAWSDTALQNAESMEFRFRRYPTRNSNLREAHNSPQRLINYQPILSILVHNISCGFGPRFLIRREPYRTPLTARVRPRIDPSVHHITQVWVEILRAVAQATKSESEHLDEIGRC